MKLYYDKKSNGKRAFIVTQSVKKLSKPLKDAMFNDFGYRLVSDDSPVAIFYMKEFDRFNKDNLSLYKSIRGLNRINLYDCINHHYQRSHYIY